MDEKIDGDSILRLLLDHWDSFSNGSYLGYEVGGYAEYEDYHLDQDEALENTWKFRKFDEILKNNYGLVDGEEVLLLIWW
jgi:hypothetical protein